jgi:hypothetical protein
MVTWSVNHPERKINRPFFPNLAGSICNFLELRGGFAAHFFLTGLRDDTDLIVQQSANRPSDVLGFAAALAKIAL